MGEAGEEAATLLLSPLAGSAYRKIRSGRALVNQLQLIWELSFEGESTKEKSLEGSAVVAHP